MKDITYRLSRRKKWKNYIGVFFSEKRGVFGFGGILLLTGMALTAPILTHFGILPPIYGEESYIGPDYAPPRWVTIFDKNIPPSGNYITNSGFENAQGWIFQSSQPTNINYSFDSEEYFAGSGSIKFTVIDDNPSETINGFSSGYSRIDWEYNPPLNASIVCVMKYSIIGNLTFRSIFPYIRFNSPNISLNPFLTKIDLRPQKEAEWTLYDRDINLILLYSLFQRGMIFDLEIGVEFREYNPTLTGTINVWFDQLELQITRPAFGMLGTNHYGQDIFAQIFWSAQLSLYTAFIGGIISAGIGFIAGLIAGYKGGIIDDIIMRIVDFILIFPTLIILFVFITQYRIPSILIPFLIAFFSWPLTARIIRSKVIVEREKLYVEAAKAAGGNDRYIMFNHILPSLLGLAIVQITTTAVYAVLLEAGLAFLGFRIFNAENVYEKRNTNVILSWGFMCAQTYFEGGIVIGAWWAIIPPGLCLALLTTSIMFVGNAIDKISNSPKFREGYNHKT